MKVACAQFSPRIFMIKYNLDYILSSMLESSRKGVDLLLFPECALTGYMLKSINEFEYIDNDIIKSSIEKISAESIRLNINVVFGTLEKRDGRWFNSCYLTTRAGEIYCQDKSHLPSIGVDRFIIPDNKPLKIFSVDDYKIGIMICYEARFPEMGRSLSLLGADIIVNPTNFPKTSVKITDFILPTRAIENRVFILSANRCGVENEVEFLGKSTIYDTYGNILAQANSHSETIICADILVEDARDKKILFSADYKHCGVSDIYEDRKPQLYIS